MDNYSSWASRGVGGAWVTWGCSDSGPWVGVALVQGVGVVSR